MYPPGTRGRFKGGPEKQQEVYFNSQCSQPVLRNCKGRLEHTLPELSVFISMLHDGVFSSFCRSQDSSLSGKARVKYDSLMEASLQPGISFTITPQDSLAAPKPARHTQVSPNKRRAKLIHELIPK